METDLQAKPIKPSKNAVWSSFVIHVLHSFGTLCQLLFQENFVRHKFFVVPIFSFLIQFTIVVKTFWAILGFFQCTCSPAISSRYHTLYCTYLVSTIYTVVCWYTHVLSCANSIPTKWAASVVFTVHIHFSTLRTFSPFIMGKKGVGGTLFLPILLQWKNSGGYTFSLHL